MKTFLRCAFILIMIFWWKIKRHNLQQMMFIENQTLNDSIKRVQMSIYLARKSHMRWNCKRRYCFNDICDFSITESDLSNKVKKFRGNLWRTKSRFGVNDNPRATRAFLSVTAWLSRMLYSERALSTKGMSAEKLI